MFIFTYGRRIFRNLIAICAVSSTARTLMHKATRRCLKTWRISTVLGLSSSPDEEGIKTQTCHPPSQIGRGLSSSPDEEGIKTFPTRHQRFWAILFELQP